MVLYLLWVTVPMGPQLGFCFRTSSTALESMIFMKKKILYASKIQTSCLDNRNIIKRYGSLLLIFLLHNKNDNKNNCLSFLEHFLGVKYYAGHFTDMISFYSFKSRLSRLLSLPPFPSPHQNHSILFYQQLCLFQYVTHPLLSLLCLFFFQIYLSLPVRSPQTPTDTWVTHTSSFENRRSGE